MKYNFRVGHVICTKTKIDLSLDREREDTKGLQPCGKYGGKLIECRNFIT